MTVLSICQNLLAPQFHMTINLGMMVTLMKACRVEWSSHVLGLWFNFPLLKQLPYTVSCVDTKYSEIDYQY